jgi:hypothetical protein
MASDRRSDDAPGLLCCVASERSYPHSATIFHQSHLLTRMTQRWSFSPSAYILPQNNVGQHARHDSNVRPLPSEATHLTPECILMGVVDG